ncbi:MAG: isopentenyl-diphosphate delta-isomerase [Saprospiraceae bacterium]|nr:isopentenyl-diphosphate delta-isomerase [Lewinella sp.]
MDKKQIDHFSKTGEADPDPTAASRKQDHIELAFASQVAGGEIDPRFYYEPLLSAHPTSEKMEIDFLGKQMALPMWVSSMTGGTAKARTINHNLARACGEFGLGMGLGSCRSLLYSDEYLPDFAVRQYIGPDFPLFANLGVAQVEELLDQKEEQRIIELIGKLKADGLIVHVNPLQEWLQPEGDRFRKAPITTIREVIVKLPDVPLIVKEVGQGMGYESLKQLFQLPLAAVDFAANGGTNFSKLELMRSDPLRKKVYEPLARIGHSAADMVNMTNQLVAELGDGMQCRQVIVSGGVRDFLDGYYYINKLTIPAVYGQASGFLRHAQGDYQELRDYVTTQMQGLQLANAYLKVR